MAPEDLLVSISAVWGREKRKGGGEGHLFEKTWAKVPGELGESV